MAAIDVDFNRTLANWCEVFAQYPIEAVTELDETKIVPLASRLEEGSAGLDPPADDEVIVEIELRAASLGERQLP